MFFISSLFYTTLSSFITKFSLYENDMCPIVRNRCRFVVGFLSYAPYRCPYFLQFFYVVSNKNIPVF